MKKAIVFEAPREGYGIDQIRRPMTVGDLMEFLEDIDPDTLFILSHDSGYTYGTIDTRTQVTTYRERENGEWEPDEWED